MNVGMLWFDSDSKASLDVRVERAATHYRNKYGKKPTLCFVHPSMLSNEDTTSSEDKPAKARISAGLEVRSNRSVLPNHFWIGVNGSSKAVPTRS